MPSDADTPLLAVDRLDVSYAGVPAVRSFALQVRAGQAVGLVGESGSGKSSVLKAVAGLLGRDGAASGSIRYRGEELVGNPRRIAALRGGRVAYVFQDPTQALDPLFTIGSQFDECIRAHRTMGRVARRELEWELLRETGFDDPDRVLGLYPFNLSGGMCQRVSLAMSLACGAELLLADEPTSALDVAVQAQVLDLLGRIRRERGVALLMVSHNIGAVGAVADELGVVFHGRLVEYGTRDEVLHAPAHPYTAALVAAVPTPDGPAPWARDPQRRTAGERPAAEKFADARPAGRVYVSPTHWALCGEEVACDVARGI